MLRKVTKINGKNIEYFLTGKGYPILFLHGLGASPRNYRKILLLLGEKYQIIAPSVPGHGASQWKDDLSIEEVSELMCVLTNKLNLKKYIIIGHSMGGLIGMYISKNHPNNVKKLVLVNSTGVGLKLFRIKEVENISLDEIESIISMNNFFGALYEVISIIATVVQNMGNQGIRKFFSEIYGDHREMFSKIKVNTIILWSANDMICPIRQAYIMRRLIPKASIRKVKGHHAWLNRKPELFVKKIMENC